MDGRPDGVGQSGVSDDERGEECDGQLQPGHGFVYRSDESCSPSDYSRWLELYDASSLQLGAGFIAFGFGFNAADRRYGDAVCLCLVERWRCAEPYDNGTGVEYHLHCQFGYPIQSDDFIQSCRGRGGEPLGSELVQ